MVGSPGPRGFAWAWLVQPLYVVVELVAALATGVGYSLTDDTISDLGARCADAGATGCSSSPWLVSTAFVVFGVLQVMGAGWLLRSARGLARSRAVVVVALLWAVAGVSSAGVGVMPVDQHPTGHALVAVPVFVCQPLALLLHAGLLPRGALWAVGTALGTVAVVGAVGFAVVLGADDGAGLWERLATWPAKLWLALVVLGPAGTPVEARSGPYTGAVEPPGPPAAA